MWEVKFEPSESLSLGKGLNFISHMTLLHYTRTCNYNSLSRSNEQIDLMRTSSGDTVQKSAHVTQTTSCGHIAPGDNLTNKLENHKSNQEKILGFKKHLQGAKIQNIKIQERTKISKL